MEANVQLNYFSKKSLLTTDLNSLFERLFNEIGGAFTVTCQEMSEREKQEALLTTDDLPLIEERFHVSLLRDGHYLRRKDIEEKAIQLGRK
ncbi:MAG: hypothetical protein HY011_10950 [Acidobacteria bacterium]|nr:hypothetical protein [Acidobacteriota bacterium]